MLRARKISQIFCVRKKLILRRQKRKILLHFITRWVARAHKPNEKTFRQFADRPRVWSAEFPANILCRASEMLSEPSKLFILLFVYMCV